MKNRIIDNTLTFITLCIVSIGVVCYFQIPAQAAQLTLEVTDFQGRMIQLQHARVFIPTPTSCDSCPPKIVTLEGIKVTVDSTQQIIRWETIERVEKEKAENDTVTIFLTDGKTKKVELFSSAEQSLSGDTDRNEYGVVRTQDVKLLKVIRKEDK